MSSTNSGDGPVHKDLPPLQNTDENDESSGMMVRSADWIAEGFADTVRQESEEMQKSERRHEQKSNENFS